MRLMTRSVMPLALLAVVMPALAKTVKVDLDYTVRFLPQTDQAEVSLTLSKGEALRDFVFNLGSEGRYSDFQTSGQWTQTDASHGTWQPAPGKGSRLSYKVKINRPRGEGHYDALMTQDWALLRGDQLIPPAQMNEAEKIELIARLQFELPQGWDSVETGWLRIGKNRFRIDNPSRNFDRPTGWIAAGKIGTRRTHLGNTDVAVTAPLEQGVRRMDILTLLSFVWPQVQEVFPRDPAKLLVVSAGDPLWRGGLSAPNSLFLHASRPLVSENGTSTLLHELTHVFSGIHGTDKSDWISEGLAEYYAIELLHRAGGMSEERYRKTREALSKWSKPVKTLRGDRVAGMETARAVLLLMDLDKELREASAGEHSLDNVTRALMRLDKVSTKDFIEVTENVLGGPSKTLKTSLLK